MKRMKLSALIGLWLALLPVAAVTFPALATPPVQRPSPVRLRYLQAWVHLHRAYVEGLN